METEAGTRRCHIPWFQLYSCIYTASSRVTTMSATTLGLYISVPPLTWSMLSSASSAALLSMQDKQDNFSVKAMNGTQSDIRNNKGKKHISEQFSLPGHSIMDFRVAITEKKELQREAWEGDSRNCLHNKYQCISMGLNKDHLSTLHILVIQLSARSYKTAVLPWLTVTSVPETSFSIPVAVQSIWPITVTLARTC